MSHLRIFTHDWYFEPKLKRNWMVRILGHLRISCICLHVSTSPSMTTSTRLIYTQYNNILLRIEAPITYFWRNLTNIKHLLTGTTELRTCSLYVNSKLKLEILLFGNITCIWKQKMLIGNIRNRLETYSTYLKHHFRLETHKDRT